MKNTFLPGTLLAALLAGCGGVDLWPFGAQEVERARVPANSTEYLCDAGKRFYLRILNNGASAWVILREREFRLDKAAAGPGTRYSNGISTLDMKGSEATLNDGPQAVFTGCKVAGSEKRS